MNFYEYEKNCVVIMYPTGGYGNFIHYLLTMHLESTVKPDWTELEFSKDGNSHNFKKYVERFDLGPAYSENRLKKFSYGYQVLDKNCYQQICQGKRFLVLGDVGNLGDNINFLRRYFEYAKIIRIYSASFEEKLINWANCMKKSFNDPADSVYKDSLHTRSGIANFCNKSVDHVTDQDAIDCMVSFFQNNFEKYGEVFNAPVHKQNILNIPLKTFFSVELIIDFVKQIAQELDTRVINSETLEKTAQEFLQKQSTMELLDSSLDSLTHRALNIYRQNTNKHDWKFYKEHIQ